MMSQTCCHQTTPSPNSTSAPSPMSRYTTQSQSWGPTSTQPRQYTQCHLIMCMELIVAHLVPLYHKMFKLEIYPQPVERLSDDCAQESHQARLYPQCHLTH